YYGGAPGYRPGYRPGPYDRGNVGQGNRPSGGRGGGATAGQLPANNNLYNNRQSRDRVATSDRRADAGRPQASTPARGSNNVYGDANGNVHRQNPNGSWDSRNNGSWNGSSGSRDLNRDAQARQQGANRSSYGNYGGSRGGSYGGSRGGSYGGS